MSTKYSEHAEDDREYPAERAYGPRRSTPAWKQIAPDLSGGYVEVHLACDAIAGLSPETVISS